MVEKFLKIFFGVIILAILVSAGPMIIIHLFASIAAAMPWWVWVVGVVVISLITLGIVLLAIKKWRKPNGPNTIHVHHHHH